MKKLIIIGALVALVLGGELYMIFSLKEQIRTLGIDTGVVLAQSGILTKTESGEIVINRVVTVADLQQ